MIFCNIVAEYLGAYNKHCELGIFIVSYFFNFFWSFPFASYYVCGLVSGLFDYTGTVTIVNVIRTEQILCHYENSVYY